MRSVRFDPELESRMRKAAERRGVTVSELIRQAVFRECEAVLGASADEAQAGGPLTGKYADQWAPLIEGIVGAIQGDGSDWQQGMADWEENLRRQNWRR